MIEFGIYLVNKGKIEPEQLVEALSKQRGTTALLGQIAIENSILSIKQVFNICSEQVDSKELFGEIAVRLGYLTSRELAELLLKQAQDYPSLSTILVASKILTPQTVNEEMALFLNEELRNLAEVDGTQAQPILPSPEESNTAEPQAQLG